MKVKSLNLEDHFTTIIHDPSPHRLSASDIPVSERRLPVVYECDNCNEKISFKTESFKKHCNSEFTNLSINENDHFESFIRANHLTKLSFLDFRCPSCHQPTKILFDGGPSGYWGEFYFEIKAALILKEVKPAANTV